MRITKAARIPVAFALALGLIGWSANLQAATLVVPRGSTVKLILKNSLSTSTNRVGDPFTAEVAEDVVINGLPAIARGATVEGAISKLEKPKRLAGLKGQATLILRFDRIRTREGEFPLVASLISVHDPVNSDSRQAVKGEGQVAAKNSTKDILTKGAIGVAGGALLGAIFGNVSKGVILGAIGGSVAILAPKGKDVNLPEGSGLQIRLDRDLEVPSRATF